jgi:hypothetical protein
MKNKTNIIIGILLLIVFGLIAYLIFSAPIEEVKSFDESSLREEIQIQKDLAKHWQDESEEWQNKAKAAENKVDSLEQLKPKVYEKYDKQRDFADTADVMQLDSFIRSNW